MTTEKEISIWSKALLLIFEVMSEEGISEKDVLSRLAKILQKKRKGYLLPKIFYKAEKAYKKKHKIELFLAQEHSRETIKKIEESFPYLFEKKENVEIKLDKDLIGGFRIKTPNFLFKASVKDLLNDLKATVN
jgi:F0F1-type ATP synthase delta subunit